jgi:hypothetical protein
MKRERAEIEWYDRALAWHGKRSPYPRLGIQKRGIGTLNKPAMDALGDPEVIAIGYAPSVHAIAIKAAEPGDRGATAVRKTGNSSTHLFSLMAFLATHGIRYGQAREYTGSLEGDFLLFKLGDENEPT